MKKKYWLIGAAGLVVLSGFALLCLAGRGNRFAVRTEQEYGENISAETRGKGSRGETYSSKEEPIKIQHTFLTCIWAHVDQEIPYVNEETFEMIKSAYGEVDYLAELERGNQEVYDEYLRKFWHLLQSDAAFWDRNLNREVFMKDWQETYGGYGLDLKKCKYFFFDMNGDGFPELCIDSVEPVVVFAYDFGKDQYILWAWLGAKDIVGTKKVILYPEYDAVVCDFFQLNDYGEIELETLFWAEFFYGMDEDINMVMFPNYLDSEKDWVITEEMKEQGVFEESSGQWFFRITDEQFEELRKPYMEAYDLAMERDREDSYTYEELFGRFEAE